VIPIGIDSQNKLIVLEFQESKNIFGSFYHPKQFEQFIISFLNLNRENQFLKIYFSGKNETIVTIQNKFKEIHLLTHFYDRPGRSSFIKKKDFLKSILGRSNKKKLHTDNIKYICIIENIWEFIRSENKPTIHKLFELIENGPVRNIHFIVSSSLPLNNLYNQIFMYLHKDQILEFEEYFNNGILICNPLGTEIIFNSDNLNFYKLHSTTNYNRLYGF